VPQTPQVSLCFLLVTGKRKTMSFDPETAVGRVKELVWNAWPTGEVNSSFILHSPFFFFLESFALALCNKRSMYRF
jgi:hypothetical protein